MSEIKDFEIECDVLLAYKGNSTVVTIPNNVKSIGDRAFSNCKSLKKVTISDSVTSIGDRAFLDCYNLKEINIPNSVTSIGDGAFSHCYSLKEITIPDSVTFIGESAFFYCDSLEEIIIPNGITSINDATFVRCLNLRKITFPNSVTYIGKDAFSDCKSLMRITLPNSLTYIGDDAFYGCNEYGIQDVNKWCIDVFMKSQDFDKELFDNLSKKYYRIIKSVNSIIKDLRVDLFSENNLEIPFERFDLLQIFKYDATPEVVFKKIYDILNQEDYGFFERRYIDECVNNMDNFSDCDDIMWNDDFNEVDINRYDYIESCSELYMLKLEILSIFIGRLGTTKETDTIVATILDTVKALADNDYFDCISKLLTDDIYKNLWFDDNIKTKIINLIK